MMDLVHWTFTSRTTPDLDLDLDHVMVPLTRKERAQQASNKLNYCFLSVQPR